MRLLAPLLLAATLCIGGIGSSQAAQYSVLVDTDENSATGCQISYPGSGTIPGIERRITANVDLATAPPMVNSITIENCEGAGLGAPTVIGGGFPVGLDNGIGGADVIEMAADEGRLFSGQGRTSARYYFVASSTGGDDVSGPFQFSISLPAPVPTLSTLGFLLLAAGLAWMTRRHLNSAGARHLSVGVFLLLAAGSLVIAANFRLDGQVGDWAGIAPLGTDPAGDGGETDSDLVAVFVAEEGNLVFFRVDVSDLENPPPQVAPATFSVAENSTNGTSVGTVTFTDTDPTQSHTFAISAGNTDGAFAIDTATGAITVANSAALDFETTPNFSLTDNGSPPRTGSATITIDLTDVNEAPTVDDATFSVAENSTIGTVVGSVVVHEPDAGQSHTFAITAGNTGDAFAIDSNGEITVANPAAVDFDTNTSFTLTVTATDNGSPALTGTGNIVINVLDVNDVPTVGGGPFTLAENSANGTTVGTATVTDPDAGQSHTFAITAGNTGGAFAIHAATGAITVADATKLDYETTPSFTLPSPPPTTARRPSRAAPRSSSTSPTPTIRRCSAARLSSSTRTVPTAPSSAPSPPPIRTTPPRP